jgi:hypothetical protein
VKDMKRIIPILLAMIAFPALGDNYAVELKDVTIFFETPLLETISVNAKNDDQFFAVVDGTRENISIQTIDVSAKDYKDTQRDSAKLWIELAGQIGFIEQLPGWIDTGYGFSVYGDVKMQNGYGYVAMKTNDLDRDGFIDYASLFTKDFVGDANLIGYMAASSSLKLKAE